MNTDTLTWCIAGIATFGVIVRPFGLPEYLWAVLGAIVLVLAGLLPWHDALAAAGKGTDVYLFLVGMMLLAEVAREEGLFDWLASLAVQAARKSAKRLFLIVYGVGTLVTIFLSNDATAVVLTPAVYAATTAARVRPLPYLLICAFIANAASFVLPISNPANLVLFGQHMPPLATWLAQFTLPSLAAIAATYLALRFTQRGALEQEVAEITSMPPLSWGGAGIAVGIGLTAIALMGASAFDRPLGLPTFVAGLAVTIGVLLISRRSPIAIVREISWGVLPLVAGLFILVEAVERTGMLGFLMHALRQVTDASPGSAAFDAGIIAACASNLLNNLPTGLIAATVVESADVPSKIRSALVIGVDLGPNLSVTGSLATILWLTALRREGEVVTAWQFLKLGLVIMPPALLLAVAALVWLSPTSF